MKKRWVGMSLADPAYSSNLTLDKEDFSLAFPPVLRNIGCTSLTNQGEAALHSNNIEEFYPMCENQLVLIHIPKTGGTTLRAVIERQYGKNDVYRIYDKQSAFNTMDDFLGLSDNEKNRIKVCIGHFSFGIHQHLPGSPLYFSMLRHPVSRVISYYHHAMTLHNNFKDQKVSLIKFINRRDTQVDNLQTRVLSGMRAPFGRCTEDMLWTAIDNMNQGFYSIGINERFDESLAVLATLLGWKAFGYVKENVSKGRPNEEYFSQMEINQIINHNRLDMMLYSYAQRKLDAQIKAMNTDIDSIVTKLKEDKIRCEATMIPKTVWA